MSLFTFPTYIPQAQSFSNAPSNRKVIQPSRSRSTSTTQMNDYYVPGSQRMAPLDTEQGQSSAVATMTLMQMVADSYERARVNWKKNADKDTVEGDDDPEHFGPVNEAQVGVEGWLVHAQFLPPRERTKSESKKSGLMTPSETEHESEIEIDSSKSLQKSRHLFPRQMLCRIKVKSLPSLSPVKIWKRMKTKTLSNTVFIRASPPLSPSREGSLASTLSTLDSETSISLNRKYKPPRGPYILRPKFMSPLRSRTMELEIEHAVAEEITRPTLPRRSATLPANIDQNTQSTDRSDLTLELIPTMRHMHQNYGAPSEIVHRRNANSNDISSPKRGLEITVWTVLGVTMLGYLCFFFVFLACFILGLKRMIHRGLSFWTNMSKKGVSDV
ncbi:hypothetical protein BDN70DRAFT_896533 [Pholiota conissans]|uniref:Uncharacterized protein n=1 Tax=Pholiota conissans TaxID=109636 RepID=A0A9P5YYI7_9AGAR|nr:hypothetical protein BDN70DRAFT_896533 [Pholiota conissans]